MSLKTEPLTLEQGKIPGDVWGKIHEELRMIRFALEHPRHTAAEEMRKAALGANQ